MRRESLAGFVRNKVINDLYPREYIYIYIYAHAMESINKTKFPNTFPIVTSRAEIAGYNEILFLDGSSNLLMKLLWRTGNYTYVIYLTWIKNSIDNRR